MLQHTATHSATHYAELEMEADILESHTYIFITDSQNVILEILESEHDILRIIYENTCFKHHLDYYVTCESVVVIMQSWRVCCNTLQHTL